MALYSCKHVGNLPPASMPDFNGALQKEGLPSMLTSLQRAPSEWRRSAEDPHGIIALKATKAPSVCPSGCTQAEVSVVELSAERAQMYWHAIETVEGVKDENTNEIFLMNLKRSQLESQWACCTEDHNRITQRQASKKGTCMRLSARQRRILSRRLGNGSSEFHCTPPEAHAGDAFSASSAGMQSQHHTMDVLSANSRGLSGLKSEKRSLLGALGTVSTLGYLRGSSVSKELLTKEEEALLAKKMKVGRNLRATRERLTKALGHEPSDELWALSVKLSYRELQTKLLEADQARDYMFLANLRLVVSVAKKYSNLGINLADLTQEGAAGLLRGLEKFDHKKGFKLSTYVHWWIRRGVTRALGQHCKTVRIPPYMYAKLTLVTRTIAKLKGCGIPVSTRSLSTALKMPEDVVSVALKATKKITSLDKPKHRGGFSPEGDSMHHYVADPRAENDPWNMVDNVSLREHVDLLITSTLCKREQEIVRLYYGFECSEGHGISYHRIGQRMGISRESARQLEGRAMRKLVVAGKQMELGIPLSY